MQSKTVVNYNYLANEDIHEFIFAEAGRVGTDEYIAFIYEIYEQHLKDKPHMLAILDIHKSGMLPVKYASLIMEKTFKELTPFPKPYIAYLSNDSSDQALIGIMDYTASTKVDRLCFPLDKRDLAIEWLVEKRNLSL